ncbi:hypothetical protein CMI42_00420 [Candidatus Pacearchaeota archaeon]|nr:hypothetical protein [Candidatus Pacearchaeota archaeon]
MKLTKKEANEIAKLYDLGKVKSFNLFSEGWVNYNFALKTEKGNYVIRVLGKKYDRDKRKLIDMEFDFLYYLNKIDFPYRVPNPLKTLNGNILTKKWGKKIWIYEMLPGKSKNPITIKKKPVAETAKALATYHKYVKNYPGRKIRKPDILKGVDKNYAKMVKVRPLRKDDRLMLENLEMFNMILKKVKKIKFDTEMLMTHSDFTSGNLLFDSKDKVVGIVDFEVASYAPKIKDIGQTLKSMCKKKNERIEFIKVYQKYNKLTNKELKQLPWIAMRDNCFYFQLFYNTEPSKFTSDEDRLRKKLTLMNWVISSTKRLLEKM